MEYPLQNRAFSLAAMVIVLVLIARNVFAFDGQETPCTVSVIAANGGIATVCYEGSRGELASTRNCSKMAATDVPKAALMLGCELRS